MSYTIFWTSWTIVPHISFTVEHLEHPTYTFMYANVKFKVTITVVQIIIISPWCLNYLVTCTSDKFSRAHLNDLQKVSVGFSLKSASLLSIILGGKGLEKGVLYGGHRELLEGSFREAALRRWSHENGHIASIPISIRFGLPERACASFTHRCPSMKGALNLAAQKPLCLSEQFSHGHIG